MRTTRFLLVATASLLLGGCGLFGGGGGAPPADAPALDELLRLSDEAMRALWSLRAETRVVPSVAGNPPYESAIELRGRRCIRDERSVREPDPSGRCPCDFVALAYEYEAFFARTEGGLNLGPPGGGTAPANLRLAGLEAIDGRPAWVVTYEFKTPSIEGPFTIRRKGVDRPREPALATPGAVGRRPVRRAGARHDGAVGLRRAAGRRLSLTVA